MQSAERILKLTELVTEALTEVFEGEYAPEEFSMLELTTGVVLSVMGIGQVLLMEEGSDELFTLEDVVSTVSEGLEVVANHVGNTTTQA